MLGRVLFKRTEISGQSINPALILQELFALQRDYDATVSSPLTREAAICRAIRGLDSSQQPQISKLRMALHTGGVAESDLDYELALQLLALYNSGCEDGCPVCLSANSDIEHHHLAPLLNSRHVLAKLRQVLLSNVPRDDCLAALADTLLAKEPVQVKANPGNLGNHLDISLGLGTVTQVDETGQVWGASTTVINGDRAKDFIANGSWERRWNDPKDLPYETPQGKRVRSPREYTVATMLEEADIAFDYEPRLPYRDEQGRTRYIHPGFYLFEYGLYIECWGREEAEYIEARAFKEMVYEQLAAQRGVRVLFLETEEVENMVFMERIQAKIRDDHVE